jgi:serine/threonine-protein kinase RsbW
MTSSTWRVELETPASTRYLHIVRLTAAGAAAEAGLDTEEIDDVKIAVDELCSAAIAALADSATIRLAFVGTGHGLTVEAHLPTKTEIDIDDFRSAILDATVDTVVVDDKTLGGGFRLTKNHRGG